MEEQAFFGAMKFEVKASVGTYRKKKAVDDVLDPGARLKWLKETWQPRIVARYVVTVNATHQQSAAPTQLEMKAVVLLKVNMRKGKAATSFLIVTNLATDAIFEAASINDIIV